MSINEDREDLQPQITAEEGTIAHQQQLAELSVWDKRRCQARELAERETWRHKLASEGDHYASHQTHIKSDNPFHSHADKQELVGAMGKGYGFTAHDGLVQIGSFRTKPEVAEGMRLSMSPAEWKANTGLEYVSVLNAPAPQQAQATELQKMQEEHQARVDAEREERQLDEEEAGNDELLDEAAIQATAKSGAENWVAKTHGDEIAGHMVQDVVDHGEPREVVAQSLGLAPAVVENAIEHHTARANAMLDGQGSSVALMQLALNDAELKTARRYYAAGAMSEFRQIGQTARNRVASMSPREVVEVLSPRQVDGCKLRDRNGVATVMIPTIGEVTWQQAITNGWVILD